MDADFERASFVERDTVRQSSLLAPSRDDSRRSSTLRMSCDHQPPTYAVVLPPLDEGDGRKEHKSGAKNCQMKGFRRRVVKIVRSAGRPIDFSQTLINFDLCVIHAFFEATASPRTLLAAGGLGPVVAFGDLRHVFFERLRESKRNAEWKPGIAGHQHTMELDSISMSPRRLRNLGSTAMFMDCDWCERLSKDVCRGRIWPLLSSIDRLDRHQNSQIQ